MLISEILQDFQPSFINRFLRIVLRISLRRMHVFNNKVHKQSFHEKQFRLFDINENSE